MAGCNLLVAIILSQYLGAEGKGTQGLIVTNIALILVFVNIVSGAVLVYLTPRYKSSLLIVPAYIWSVFIGILAILIFFSTNLLKIDYAIHVVLLTVLNSLFTVNVNILIGKEDIKAANLLNTLQSISVVFLLLVSYALLRHCDITFYIYSLYISYLVTLVFSFFKLKKHIEFKFYQWKEYYPIWKDSFKFGLINQASHITQLLNFRIAYYFLDYYSGKYLVGVYSNAIQISESIWIISSSICMVQYSKISNSTDYKQSQILTSQLVQMGLTITFVLCLILTLFPSEFFTFIFGKDFSSISLVIKTLMPGIFIYNFALIIGHYFSGIGKYKINTFASLVGLVSTLILSPILIKSMPLIGAGLASSISYTCTSIFIIFAFVRESKMPIFCLLPKYSIIKQQFFLIKNGLIK